jgi:hypothetical protein
LSHAPIALAHPMTPKQQTTLISKFLIIDRRKWIAHLTTGFLAYRARHHMQALPLGLELVPNGSVPSADVRHSRSKMARIERSEVGELQVHAVGASEPLVAAQGMERQCIEEFAQANDAAIHVVGKTGLQV